MHLGSLFDEFGRKSGSQFGESFRGITSGSHPGRSFWGVIAWSHFVNLWGPSIVCIDFTHKGFWFFVGCIGRFCGSQFARFYWFVCDDLRIALPSSALSAIKFLGSY
jgi:hypothetical protein